jgi:hypothetical protein
MAVCNDCLALEKQPSTERPHGSLSKLIFEMDFLKATGGTLEGSVHSYECRRCGSTLTRADIPSNPQACRWEFAKRG